ncbi:protein kinase [Nocardioides sp. W3-2-3]|nr:protein kinase [Nocardioides convexus]
MIHRDIKPQNLLLRSAPDGGERVMVADLGVAKAMLHASGLTQVVGTPSYMAPEQAHGVGLDLRADVHALGAVTYHLMTGRLVRDGGSERSRSRCCRPRPRPWPTYRRPSTRSCCGRWHRIRRTGGPTYRPSWRRCAGPSAAPPRTTRSPAPSSGTRRWSSRPPRPSPPIRPRAGRRPGPGGWRCSRCWCSC